MSRNRNFDEHATARGADARRLLRFLRAIERDVLRADVVEVGTTGGRVTLSFRFRDVKLRRVVQLTAAEYQLLLEGDAAVAERLAR